MATLHDCQRRALSDLRVSNVRGHRPELMMLLAVAEQAVILSSAITHLAAEESIPTFVPTHRYEMVGQVLAYGGSHNNRLGWSWHVEPAGAGLA